LYPFIAGYASTIYKLQGAELEHITIWLDRPYVRAAAYMALARIRYDSNYLIGGKMSSKHFVPADYKPRAVRSTRMSGVAWRLMVVDLERDPGEPQEHHLPIQQIWADAIRQGTKIVEARFSRGLVRRIRMGDTLILGGVRTHVTHVEQYETFHEMLEGVGFENALPGAESMEEAVGIYKAFRGYAAFETDFGVRAFHLELSE
jgi:ASC-1-like (ASCH) protein